MQNNNNILVDVKGLQKTFKGEVHPALQDISLTLKSGEMAALVGPDGAGKTTFMRLLCGLLVSDYDNEHKDENGPIKVGGFSPYSSLSEVKKIVGYMPQRFGLYEDLTVIENLNLYSSLRQDRRDNQLQKDDFFRTLLDFSGLKDFTGRLAGALSGGMKQKLGLCCTLLSRPQLLLLDEPSVGVDPVSRRDLMTLVQNLVKTNNIAVIWSTSYLDEAQNFERVFLFSEGKKIYDGSPNDAAEKLKGRVYMTKKEGVNNRALLRRILRYSTTGITDGIIEGDGVRIVLADKNLAKDVPLQIEELEPRFEDAVIDMLGGQKPYDDRFILDLPEQSAPDIVIKANSLTKVYGSGEKKFIAANKISFEIKKGEIFGLLGPNGAGKSTTFKMLCNLVRPTEGDCSIMGVEMAKNPVAASSHLGYMAQKFSLFGNLSVKQNLDFFGGVYGMTGAYKRDKIDGIFHLFDLEKYSNINAQELPLGFKQRLALACAIIHNPPVLFLDEPTSGVDPISRREFWNQINSLVEKGTTVLVTTHFMDEAQFCDRISMIFKGKALVTATPDELKASVRTEANPNPTMEDAFVGIIDRNMAKTEI